MYTGHFAFALAGKGIRRDAPLWLLVLATQGCDWMQAVACTAMASDAAAMWSHSIPAVLVLAALVGIATYTLTWSGAGVALVVAITMSHILADYVTGLKPTWPGGPMIGLGLYAHPAADFAVEAAVLTAGWLVYRRSLPADGSSRRHSWVLLAVLLGIQLVGILRLGLLPHAPKCY